MSAPEINHKSKNHQLNFQGCRCQLCEKVSLNQNNLIIFFLYHDNESESYHPQHHKQGYLQLIDEFVLWERYIRKIRFALPQTCVFFEGFPSYWVTKNKDNSPIKVIRSRSKMNVFQIQHFFLQSYLLHHPQVINKKRQKDSFKGNARKQCIVAAKYAKNSVQLLTLDQIQNLFKSKYKYMREGLMYLQTLVGAHHCQQYLIKIDLQHMQKEHKDLYDRAKQEAKIFVNETKVTDSQFVPQKAQIQFEKHLKSHVKRYLTYLSLKIIFISSKHKATIIKESVFKWAYVHGSQFLWDIRIQKQVSNAPYWQNSVMKALEVKLKKTMSMMELQPQKNIHQEQISHKAKQFSNWLQESTSKQWNQMKIIRQRLQKLQSQKKALLESQKNDLQTGPNKAFRFRNIRKRQIANKSVNKEYNASKSFNGEW